QTHSPIYTGPAVLDPRSPVASSTAKQRIRAVRGQGCHAASLPAPAAPGDKRGCACASGRSRWPRFLAASLAVVAIPVRAQQPRYPARPHPPVHAVEPRPVTAAPAYAIGSLAIYWILARVAGPVMTS